MSEEDLVGYSLDGLELDEQAVVERLLDDDERLCRRLDRIRRSLSPLSEDDLIDAPAGLAEQTLARLADGTAAELSRVISVDEWSSPTTRLRLIDTIVVASLLVVAATLVLPAIACIRGDQARVLCSNQLRNLGIALNIYAQQEKGALPAVAAGGPENFAGSFAVALTRKGLVLNGAELLCPSANSAIVTLKEFRDGTPESPDKSAFLRTYASGSYGYTLGFRDPAQANGFRLFSSTRPVIADRPPRQGEVKYVNSPNHDDRGQNVLFGDGTVRWQITRYFGADDLYLNRRRETSAGEDADDFVIGASEAVAFPEQCRRDNL